MAWAQSERDRERLRGLARLEDRRLAFARGLAAQGIALGDALLVQVGGGFEGVALSGGRLLLLSGPAPGDEGGRFALRPLDGAELAFAPCAVEPEGMGGMLGMGKKGGAGLALSLSWPGGACEIPIVPALQCALDVRAGEPLPLTDVRRRRGDANLVWDFRPIDRAALDRIAARWTALAAGPGARR